MALKHQLSLNIVDGCNPNNFTLIDTSNYASGVPLTCPTLAITIPGRSGPLYFSQGTLPPPGADPNDVYNLLPTNPNPYTGNPKFVFTIDNIFLSPTFATGFIANSSSSIPGSVGMSFNFTKGYLVNANGTVTFASPPQPYMDFDGRMLNNSQTYSASRSYPFNPLAIAYTDY